MRIRPEQVEPFRNKLMEQYVQRMAEHLRTRCPKETEPLEDEPLRQHVRDGIAKAESHGVTDENDIRRFLEYWTRFGPEFGESPETQWARPYLGSEEMTGTRKMDSIDNYYVYVLQLGGRGG